MACVKSMQILSLLMVHLQPVKSSAEVCPAFPDMASIVSGRSGSSPYELVFRKYNKYLLEAPMPSGLITSVQLRR